MSCTSNGFGRNSRYRVCKREVMRWSSLQRSTERAISLRLLTVGNSEERTNIRHGIYLIQRGDRLTTRTWLSDPSHPSYPLHHCLVARAQTLTCCVHLLAPFESIMDDRLNAYTQLLLSCLDALAIDSLHKNAHRITVSVQRAYTGIDLSVSHRRQEQVKYFDSRCLNNRNLSYKEYSDKE